MVNKIIYDPFNTFILAPPSSLEKRLKSVWRKFTSLPYQNMNLLPGDKLHCSHKTQSSSSSCSFPLFLPPSMSSIWRGCRGWRALPIPWQTWASEAGTCQGYFYCRCPWGFTKLFRALCLSSLSFSVAHFWDQYDFNFNASKRVACSLFLHDTI